MAFPTFAIGMFAIVRSSGMGCHCIAALRSMSASKDSQLEDAQLMSSLVFTLESHPKAKWGLLCHGGSQFWNAFRSSSSIHNERSTGTRTIIVVGMACLVSEWYARELFGCIPPVLLSRRRSTLVSCWSGCMDRRIHSRLPFSKKNRRSLIASSLVPILWSAGFYLCFVWMAIYMAELIDPAVPHAFGVNSAALLFSVCILFPIAGHLSDTYGRLFIMTIGGISMMVLSPILIVVVGQGNSAAAFFAQSTLGIALSFWGSPMCAWLVESFDPASRLTSVAIGYNIAQALVGGATPALATLSVDNLGPYAPGLLLTVFAIISLIGLRCVAPHAITNQKKTVKDGILVSSVPPARPSSYEHPAIQHDDASKRNNDEPIVNGEML